MRTPPLTAEQRKYVACFEKYLRAWAAHDERAMLTYDRLLAVQLDRLRCDSPT